MHFQWNEYVSPRGLFVMVLLMAGVVGYGCMANFRWIVDLWGSIGHILLPFWISLFFAFLLYTPVRLLEKHLFHACHPKTARRLAILVGYGGFLVLTGLFVGILIPALGEPLRTLSDKLPILLDRVPEFWASLGFTMTVSVGELLPGGMDAARVASIMEDVSRNLWQYARDAVWLVLSLLGGFCISIYWIAGRERIFPRVMALLQLAVGRRATRTIRRFLREVFRTLNRFIGGQALDSLIFGTVLYLVLLLFGIPYALLVAVICTFTNMIPMVGPFMGAIPSALVILTESPYKMLLFVLITLVLQQIDGNIVAPRIVGDRLGLRPFWILFAVTLGGGVGGIPGILLTIPLFSVIWSAGKTWVEHRLAQKGMPVSTHSDLFARPFRG